MGCLKLSYYNQETALEVNGNTQKKHVMAYRYGFNGQERDSEWKGDGNSYDFVARGYDPRLGRFLSRDPLSKHLSFFTPYQFASNSPILMIDKYGLIAWPSTSKWTYDDILGFGEFVQAEIKRITAEAAKLNMTPGTQCDDNVYPTVCFDCADFVVTTLIKYAHENGKVVAFTLADGTTIYSNSTTKFNFKGIGEIRIENVDDFIRVVRGLSDANSILNDMVILENDDVKVGDVMNTGGHTAFVVNDELKPGIEYEGGMAYTEGFDVWQGNIPPEIPRSSYSWGENIYRYDYLDVQPDQKVDVGPVYDGQEVDIDLTNSIW